MAFIVQRGGPSEHIFSYFSNESMNLNNIKFIDLVFKTLITAFRDDNSAVKV